MNKKEKISSIILLVTAFLIPLFLFGIIWINKNIPDAGLNIMLSNFLYFIIIFLVLSSVLFLIMLGYLIYSLFKKEK